ncbi:MAG TPA: hypothetical protein VGA10_00960, partial [Thermoanaerobaculia bacterium]
TDTPVKVTLLSNGVAVGTKTIAAGATDSITAGVGASLPLATNAITVRLEPAGTIGADASYLITATYPFSIPPRHRPSRR